MSLNEVVDLSKVSPQQTFLVSQPEKPSPTSTIYIKRYTTKNNDETENHTVIGVHIILAQNDPNGIWKALHVDRTKQQLDPQNPRVATKSLNIYCDTLEVRGEFCLPEAKVVVYARRINWATPDAAINTSPLEWRVGKARNAQGTQARTARTGATPARSKSTPRGLSRRATRARASSPRAVTASTPARASTARTARACSTGRK
jgi:hypothetical protein